MTIARRLASVLGAPRNLEKVVDSNFLQTEGLRTYLSASPNNRIILTDYAAMEAYKGDTLKSIHRSMEILSQFPKQVSVLKATQTLCSLTGHAAALRKSLIDDTQTREFAQYCGLLHMAERGDQSLQKQLLEHGEAATAHMDRMLQDMPTLSSGLALMAKDFSPAEVVLMRKEKGFPQELHRKLIEHVLLLTSDFFREHPSSPKPPSGSEIRDTFIFRYALCSYILFLKSIETGGPPKANRKKLRNDVVDVHFAAVATYFDGLLTNDSLPATIHADAKLLLGEVFAAPPKWLRLFLSLGGLSRKLNVT